MSEAAQELSTPDATQRVVSEISSFFLPKKSLIETI